MWDGHASRGVISASLIFNDDFKCKPNDEKERIKFES